MSSSPRDAVGNPSANQRFQNNQSRLYELLREGKSFSGHERNCCFLNLDGRKFADVSGISGFNFLGDARGMGICDWDHDGDQDIWITNRTAPRLQFLRNNTPAAHGSLSIQLVGTTCNRDAIGARVEVVVSQTPSEQRLVQSLRAGEGYLGQSSKWLHFGLGAEHQVQEVMVTWPGGATESFGAVELPGGRGRFQLKQGQGQALPLPMQRPQLALNASSSSDLADTSAIRATTVLPIPIPELSYRSWADEKVSLKTHHGKPLLVSLWAGWCRPCLQELTMMETRQQAFRDCGLEILALSVDTAADAPSDGAANGQSLLDKMQFPFPSGAATADLLDKLQFLQDELFGLSLPLPLPTSVLLDASGDLVAIYKGPIEAEEVIADVVRIRSLSEPTQRIYNRFNGYWLREPKYDVAVLATRLIDAGYLDESLDYIRSNRARLGNAKRSRLLSQLGAKHLERGELAEAEQRFRNAIEVSPADAGLHHGLATVQVSAGNLDAAMATFRKALRLQPDHALANLDLAETLRKSGRVEASIPLYQRAIEANPDNPKAHHNLGVVLLMQGKVQPAVAKFRTALQLDPDDADIHRNLGLAFAAAGQRQLAINHLRRCLQLQPNDASVHNNLGGLLAQAAQWKDAKKHFQRAVELSPDNAKYQRNLAKIQQRGKQ